MEELASVKAEILELLKQKQYVTLRNRLSEMMEADIASIMDSMEDEDSLKLFRILPKTMAADVFAELRVRERHQQPDGG